MIHYTDHHGGSACGYEKKLLGTLVPLELTHLEENVTCPDCISMQIAEHIKKNLYESFAGKDVSGVTASSILNQVNAALGESLHKLVTSHVEDHVKVEVKVDETDKTKVNIVMSPRTSFGAWFLGELDRIRRSRE
jgi:hypothetical protein